ncbi:MAG: metal-dependent transcriptional regulator [Clostridiales bacterium]|nr:metal-dependent transcriptional regulator [Clostridiales bacterium]
MSSAKKRYLFVIYELGKHSNKVSSKDIALSLKIKRSSVSKMLKAISDDNLIRKEYYGKVQFSEQGAQIANQLYNKYVLLYAYFYRHLKVSANEARHDAILCLCDLSDNSVRKISSLVLTEHHEKG